jgi:hypothetical protein
VLYCNLEKKVKDYLINNENDLLIKEEIEKIKKELREIKTENNSSKQDNGDSLKIKDELDKINSIMHELRYQKNVNLDTPNYLEYTLLYADFENCGICMYCPSEPYEPDNDISSGPIIDNEKYTNLKNILNN